MSDDKKTPADVLGEEGFFPSEMIEELTTIPHPYGGTIQLHDLTWNTFYSAFVVEPFSETHTWDVFHYGRSQAVAGTESLKATAAHTNLPRSGDSGLPKNWGMLACKWRAITNLPLIQPVLDWAAETAVQFEYNQKPYANATLADLILAGHSIVAPGSRALPVRIRENLAFGVRVQTDNQRVLDQLRNYLRDAQDDRIREALTQLDVIADMVRGIEVTAVIRKVQASLYPGRSLTCWIRLEGPIVRTVV